MVCKAVGWVLEPCVIGKTTLRELGLGGFFTLFPVTFGK